MQDDEHSFPFPKVEYASDKWDDLSQEGQEYIAYLETRLGEYELLAERLNTDRIEAHRTNRMRDYAERIRPKKGLS
jgi:expansin (peptidoglycan-binding protein)